MKELFNPDYISYKEYFMPEVYAQRIKVSKVPKLFITIDNKVPYSRNIYWNDKNHHGVFYKFKLPVLETIVYNVVLNLAFYGIKYNEQQIH